VEDLVGEVTKLAEALELLAKEIVEEPEEAEVHLIPVVAVVVIHLLVSALIHIMVVRGILSMPLRKRYLRFLV
jgi:hypothetical protein